MIFCILLLTNITDCDTPNHRRRPSTINYMNPTVSDFIQLDVPSLPWVISETYPELTVHDDVIGYDFRSVSAIYNHKHIIISQLIDLGGHELPLICCQLPVFFLRQNNSDGFRVSSTSIKCIMCKCSNSVPYVTGGAFGKTIHLCDRCKQSYKPIMHHTTNQEKQLITIGNSNLRWLLIKPRICTQYHYPSTVSTVDQCGHMSVYEFMSIPIVQYPSFVLMCKVRAEMSECALWQCPLCRYRTCDCDRILRDYYFSYTIPKFMLIHELFNQLLIVDIYLDIVNIIHVLYADDSVEISRDLCEWR